MSALLETALDYQSRVSGRVSWLAPLISIRSWPEKRIEPSEPKLKTNYRCINVVRAKLLTNSSIRSISESLGITPNT